VDKRLQHCIYKLVCCEIFGSHSGLVKIYLLFKQSKKCVLLDLEVKVKHSVETPVTIY